MTVSNKHIVTVGIFTAQRQRAAFIEVQIFRRFRLGFWFKGPRGWFNVHNDHTGYELDLWRFSFAYLK